MGATLNIEDIRLRGIQPRPVQILHIWFWIALLIVVYSLVWYILNAVVQAFILTMLASFPEYYSSNMTSLAVVFFQNLWTYSLEIVILAGVLLGVYAEVQRKRAEKWLYG